MSALDIALDMLRTEVGVYAPQEHDPVEAARSELSSLRQRVEDLELMLRAALCGDITSITEREHRIWIKGVNPMLDDDGTGLPILTNEAREELGKR